jgi:PAS domain S-box-containing protein
VPNEKIRDIIREKIKIEMERDNRKRERAKEERRLRRERDPMRGLFWGMLLVLLGSLFFAGNRGWLTGRLWWEALVIGLGAILILESIVRYLNPVSRSFAAGRLVPGAILLFFGLAFTFDIGTWWPVALAGVGVALFLNSMVLHREVRTRQATQETLYESELKYRQIIDSANSIILEMDPQGGITFVNKYAREFFGYPEADILSRNVVGTIIPQTVTAEREQTQIVADVVVHPENYLHYEQENVLKNGARVWVVWTYKPLFDEDGKLKEILCIGINETEKKKAEELIAQQLKERTAVEERNRLARDLHDAVSQTLFSTSLIAEVLPKLWERNPIEGKKRLEEIRQLTRGALAEMRTLLLELRPVSLKDAELGDLLRQLGESVNGRARIPVSVEIQGHSEISPEAKVALYRIAQEALNNVAKHSGASQANVLLDCQPQAVKMTVSDNGKGFDPAAIQAQSLGVGIMKERAREINARLSIDSQQTQGTRITVDWSPPPLSSQKPV